MMNYIVLDGKKTNDYTRGRISGVIHVLSGMPDKGYAWGVSEDMKHWTAAFEGDNATLTSIVDAIEKLYPGVIVKTKTI